VPKRQETYFLHKRLSLATLRFRAEARKPNSRSGSPLQERRRVEYNRIFTLKLTSTAWLRSGTDVSLEVQAGADGAAIMLRYLTARTSIS
jgi:hypothetical protein